jgi:GNAT superfamily N-acetyltransferase
LHKLGYKLIDPSILLGSPIERLDKTFDGEFHVAPNEKMKALWFNAGINEKRLNVMNRAKVLKSYVTIDNTAVAFVAIYNSIAMVHALEVTKVKQRQGFGKKIMQQIAGWAATNGADYLAVITVHNNLPAKSLYQHLRMTKLGNYHYRIKL